MPPRPEVVPLLEAMANLSTFHREHEKYYSVAPREQAVVLQRHARTLHALADRWGRSLPPTHPALNPYEGAPDLNADVALQLDGVLFMEDGSEPGELVRLKRDLRLAAGDAADAGEWLTTAMASSWEVGSVLLGIDGLADLVGERHRIIANNWQAAGLMALAGRILGRAADLLDRVDLSAAAVRADLAGPHASPGRLASAAEMLDHAADLMSEFAALVHDNERRWRTFRERVLLLLATVEAVSA